MDSVQEDWPAAAWYPDLEGHLRVIDASDRMGPFWCGKGRQTKKGRAMPIGVLFWVLMVIWFLFGLYLNRADLGGGNYGALGGNLLLFVLLGLIGWRVFGPVVQ